MSMKKTLLTLIILTIFFTGCSNYQVRQGNMTLPDNATKQKTMTKIQNDINEIIDKDYNYVLSNLGEPDTIAYWIDKSKVNNIQSIEDMEKLADINLIYLKDISDEETASSALYLQLDHNKVKNGQIIDYSNHGISKLFAKSKILVNCYTDGDIVKSDDLSQKNLDDFIGIDSNDMEKIVGDKKVSYEAYLFDKKSRSINLYKLDGDNKLLAIFIENNKVSQIQVFDNQIKVASIIKNIMRNK